MNENLGTVTAIKGETAEVETGIGSLTGHLNAESVAVGDRVAAMWRPESGTMTNSDPVAANRLRGTVKASMFVGSYTEQVVDVAGQDVRVQVPGANVLSPGDDVWVEISEVDVLVMPAEDT